jgi:hypothetical protein
MYYDIRTITTKKGRLLPQTPCEFRHQVHELLPLPVTQHSEETSDLGLIRTAMLLPESVTSFGQLKGVGPQVTPVDDSPHQT